MQELVLPFHHVSVGITHRLPDLVASTFIPGAMSLTRFYKSVPQSGP